MVTWQHLPSPEENYRKRMKNREFNRVAKNRGWLFALYYMSCVACSDSKPSVPLTPEASEQISRMWISSSRARAERMNCLELKGDTLYRAPPVSWQVVPTSRDGVTALSSECPEGTVHSHVFPDSNGTIDSLFSKGDLSQHRPGLTYCVAYTSDRMRCKTPSWEGVVTYGRKR